MKLHNLLRPIALACAIVLGATASANAFDWTGFYAGIHGGGSGVVHATNLDPDGLSPIPVLGAGVGTGLFAGIHGGGRYDLGNFVVGAELSGSLGETISSGTVPTTFMGTTMDAIENFKVGPTGRLVGTAGFEILDGVLVSLDAGVAIARIESSGEIVSSGMTLDTYGNGGGTYFGPTGGLRVDVALNDDMSVFIAGNIARFGGIESPFTTAAISPAQSELWRGEIKAGFNWRFN